MSIFPLQNQPRGKLFSDLQKDIIEEKMKVQVQWTLDLENFTKSENEIFRTKKYVWNMKYESWATPDHKGT